MGAQLGSGFPLQAWGTQLPLSMALPTPPATPKLLSEPLISPAAKPDGALGVSTNTYVPTHTCWTCMYAQSHRVTHSHVHTVDESPQFPVCHHGHSASIDMPPRHCPWLIELPLLFPVHLSGRGREGERGHGREVSVSLEPPRTFLAWVRSQKLPPSRNLSRLSSRLTPCPRAGQLDSVLMASECG